MPRNPRNVRKDPIIETTLRVQAAGAGVSLPLNTKGDLLVHNGSAPVRVGVGVNYDLLMAYSFDDEGMQWFDLRNHPYYYTYPGFSLFGDGFDGSVTISVNTTVASANNKIVKRYSDLTINDSCTLNADASTVTFMVYVSGTLNVGNSSSLTGNNNGSFGTGGTAGTGGAGAGGAGGTGNGYLQLFARNIIGPITGTAFNHAKIGSWGGNAGHGTNATTPTGNSSGSNGGGLSGGVNGTHCYGELANLTMPGVGVRESTVATAAGGIQTSVQKFCYDDPESHMFIHAWGVINTSGSCKAHFTSGSTGGAGGRAIIGGVAGLPGSSGAGSSGYYKAGSAGGAGGTSGNQAGNYASGGSGGGGGPGNYARIVCATLTRHTYLDFTCDGGNGGNAGTPIRTAETGSVGGSGGGGGGVGGILWYIGPAPTNISAAAGAGGAKTDGLGNGGNGVAGTAGTAGIVFNLRSNS